ncbi:RHS repeat-associated core domain-containing protein, partial [Pseudoalteromonas sp. McH1-42]
KRTEFGGEKGLLLPILNGDISTFIPIAQETRYVGNVEFVRYGGQSTWVSKRYIAGKVLITTVNNQATTRFMLDDHLGSTHVIADASGKKEQVMSFDVFGARRNATTWARDFSDQNKFTSKLTLRGYTGHEQMDEVGLVHMGGRIYDPILGRFLQADPMVQAPNNIQNLNRYSYVMNNPLNKTDPSGYIFATIAIWALNAAISQGIITGVTATVLSGLLTAYSYYGYAKLAVGIIQAANQGGTALANFAGGWAKGFAKGQAVTCMLNMAAGGGCIDGLETKEQGNAETDGQKKGIKKGGKNEDGLSSPEHRRGLSDKEWETTQKDIKTNIKNAKNMIKALQDPTSSDYSRIAYNYGYNTRIGMDADAFSSVAESLAKDLKGMISKLESMGRDDFYHYVTGGSDFAEAGSTQIGLSNNYFKSNLRYGDVPQTTIIHEVSHMPSFGYKHEFGGSTSFGSTASDLVDLNQIGHKTFSPAQRVNVRAHLRYNPYVLEHSMMGVNYIDK